MIQIIRSRISSDAGVQGVFRNMERETVMRTKWITKVYAMGKTDVRALRGIDLTVERGKMITIVGASGSGKSTLMNIIGCLDYPTSSTYFLDAVHVEGLSRNRLDDEPLGNLDTKTSVEVLSLFQELYDQGMTIPMITHEADVADCTERITELRDGKIILDKHIKNRRSAKPELYAELQISA